LRIDAMPTTIRLSSIQPWRAASPAGVANYVRQLKAGTTLPPISVIRQRGPYRYRIGDGYHRARAHVRAGRKSVKANIIVDERG
jgi:uncharacterized ParB-like nuclease family protein